MQAGHNPEPRHVIFRLHDCLQIKGLDVTYHFNILLGLNFIVHLFFCMVFLVTSEVGCLFCLHFSRMFLHKMYIVISIPAICFLAYFTLYEAQAFELMKLELPFGLGDKCALFLCAL